MLNDMSSHRCSSEVIFLRQRKLNFKLALEWKKRIFVRGESESMGRGLHDTGTI